MGSLASSFYSDLNAKHSFWIGAASSPSGSKLLNLLHKNEFEISVPLCPTLYFPAGNDNALDIAVYNDVQVSEVIVYDILDSDHQPIIFHLLNHVRTRNI
jgi:hypothetical protein